MKARYDWKDADSKMLRMLRNSKTLKEKYGWSRRVGAGFVKEDLTDATLLTKKRILIVCPSWDQTVKTGDLNLRETEELITFLEGRQ